MISPLAFDALLAATTGNSANAVKLQHQQQATQQSPELNESPKSNGQHNDFAVSNLTGLNGNGGTKKRKQNPMGNEDGIGEKRPRTNSNNYNNNNDTHSNHSTSPTGNGTTSRDGTGGLSMVEQQLAASSPNALFQQTLLDLAAAHSQHQQEKRSELLMCGNGSGNQAELEEATATGEQQQDGGPPQMIDFFEAQKAFQKLCNQFAGFDQPQQQQQRPTTNPFQQLAQLSPFFMALQSQQSPHLTPPSQFCTAGFDPAALFGGHFLANTSQGGAHTSTISASSPPPRLGASPGEFGGRGGEEECDFAAAAAVITNGQQHEGGIVEPEDLSIRGRRAGGGDEDRDQDSTDLNGNTGTGSQNGAAAGQQPWSYEEQFKQLYDLSDDPVRRDWLDDWLQFMHRIGKPVTRIPIMAKQLYRLVVQHGGLVEVINKKLWREITKGLNLPNSITSAAFTLRTQYQKYLFDYECHRHNFSTLADLTAAIDQNKREGRRPPGSEGGSTPSASNQNNHNHHRPLSEQHHQNLQQQRGDHQQQLNINSAAAQMMAAALSAAAAAAAPPGTFGAPNFGGVLPPPPPSVAAAFFGKQLNFGVPQRDEDVQQQLNALSSSAKQAIKHFGLIDLVEQSGGGGTSADRHKEYGNGSEESTAIPFCSENIFPKLEFAEQLGIVGSGNDERNTPLAIEAEIPTSIPSNSTGNAETTRQVEKATAETVPSHQQPTSLDLTSVGDAVDFAAETLGPFGQLLKNATRCSLKMNSDKRPVLNGMENASTMGASSTATGAESMVVSMELNGVLYQGVLFAIPTAGGEAQNGERQASSPQQQQAVHGTEEQ